MDAHPPDPKDAPTQDQPCRKRWNENAKSFVDILAEELGEIHDLREKRGWKDPVKESGRHSNGADIGTAVNPATELRQAVPCGPPKVDRDKPEYADEVIRSAHACKLVGLAFSGGGIRSATFNLGVLQGLADLCLLRRFDYLSTVSGGGYIGSWLVAWIRRRGLDAAIRGLQTNREPNRDHWEVEQIRFLREYSNYLTPRLGFFSLDTWAMIATYLRNTLLNLTILVFALAAVLMLPHAGVAVDALVRGSNQWPLLCAAALLFLIVEFIAVNTASGIFGPSREEPPSQCPPKDEPPPRSGFACFTHPIYALVVGAALLPAAWFLSIWLRSQSLPAGRGWLDWAVRGAVVYFVLWLVARGVAWVAEQISRCWTKKSSLPVYVCHVLTLLTAVVLFWLACKVAFPCLGWAAKNISSRSVIIAAAFLTVIFFIVTWFSRRRSVPREYLEFLAMLFATPYAGALGGVLLGGLISVFTALAGRNWGPFHVLVFGTPLVVAALLLVTTLHVGLMGLMLRNQKREWWSRLSGWVLILALVWLVVCGLSLYAWPFPGAYGQKLIGRLVKWGLTPAWILSTIGGILGGKSQLTGDNKRPWLEWAVSLAPYIFVAGLLAALSYSLSGALTALDRISWAPKYLSNFLKNGHAAPSYLTFCLPQAARSLAVWFLAGAVILFVAAIFLAWRVDINQFSMHLFYRNRLVRCYLGASHGMPRKPQPFTGFDAEDDILLKDLRAKDCYSGPFPIVNATLNLVKGKELAWQERKAESFVFTPLHCGFDTWLERLRAPKPELKEYAYRPTECYAYPDRGFRLGTAMSISGAAASPNMGYHSKPALAFLMTVFNVRLGWWAGNPRKRTWWQTWQRPSPLLGLGCLLSELTGNTDDESRYVYLSDGGHFENLGIYELVKRRCKYILACDASADGSYAFGDLGNAIRKCREDIGVEIKINTEQIVPRRSNKRSVCHCTVGEIHYENVDPGASPEHPGILVYIKASLTGDEPADVLNYKTDHPTFPHETTVDQWFSESQFESYRRLGQHIACTLFEKAWGAAEQGRAEVAKLCNQQLFEALREVWPSSPANC